MRDITQLPVIALPRPISILKCVLEVFGGVFGIIYYHIIKSLSL